MRIFAATLRGSHDPAPGGHSSLPLDRAASLVLDAGFRKVVLGAPLHDFQWEKLQGLLPRESIAAIEIFLPHPRALRPGTGSPFDAAPVHPEARRDSLRQASETIIVAERHSVPVVIVPPARLEGVTREEVLALRGDRLFPEKLARILERRRPEARARMDGLLGFLSKLLPAAERYEVRLALVPSGFPHEVPGAEETEAALREFQGAPLRTWLDPERIAAGIELDPAALPRWERLAAVSEGATLGEDAARAPRPLLERAPVWAIDPPGQGFEDALVSGMARLAELDRGQEAAPPGGGGILAP
jgi:hypothetical protein